MGITEFVLKDDTDSSEDNIVIIGTKKVFDLQVKLRGSATLNQYDVLFGLTTDPEDDPTDLPYTFPSASSTLQMVVFFVYNV